MELDQRGGDGGAVSLDRADPEQPRAHGADQPGEQEEERAPGRHATQPAGDEYRDPQADGADEQVDPEAREWIAGAEPLTDEDRRGRRAERPGEREDVHGLWHDWATHPTRRCS